MMTPGPWALRGSQIRADNGAGRHIATYMTDREDGRILAAAREMYDLLIKLEAESWWPPDAHCEGAPPSATQKECNEWGGDAMSILTDEIRPLLARIAKKEPWE